MVVNILLFFLGTIFLYYGAEFLITGSKTVAGKYKISPLVVGITLVAFGTSLPELIVSIFANLQDESGIVVGNVMGSNIANIGLVLGATVLVKPIHFTYTKIKYDLWFMLGITLLTLVFIYQGALGFWQGIIFLSLLAGYIYHLTIHDHVEAEMEESQDAGTSLITAIKIILGIAGLGIGAHFFVMGAKGIAIALGVSTLVIGMSIVALGTSLPELAASLAAAKHGEAGFVIGNIIGSNIINLVAVLGITILVQPIPILFTHVSIQSIFLLGLTLFLVLILKKMNGIPKISGYFLLAMYATFLILNFQPEMVLND